MTVHSVRCVECRIFDTTFFWQTLRVMSEYVLKVDDKPQAEALLTYLRSLDFVELLPKKRFSDDKQEAISEMKSLLAGLPNREDYTQEAVNQALNELRASRNDQ